VRLEYVEPLTDADGKPVTLAPLREDVIPAALSDQQRLAYRTRDDLGGFTPAEVGRRATSGGGVSLVGRSAQAEIPKLAEAGGGNVTSFAPLGSGSTPPEGGTPPDNGGGPVPGLGTPAPFLPPTNDNVVPPPNQGFGGKPAPPPPPPTTTPTIPTVPPPTTTTTPTTTTAPTTTAPTTTAPTTTTTPGPAPPPAGPLPPAPAGPSCGTTGLTIVSDHATCRIYAVNMAPGDSASEVLTLRNDTDLPFTLSLRATGTPNRLWNDLRLGVWEAGTAPPQPLPPLLWWTTQASTLAILQPGESIRYRIELFLPTSAGNEDQALAAVVDFVWRAQS
jgi:hypothetical protein